MRGLLKTVLTAALAFPLVNAALPKISRSGKFLYDDSGKRFFIKVRHSISLLFTLFFYIRSISLGIYRRPREAQGP